MSRSDLLDEDGENRALRSFLMQYGLPGLTVAAMAQHMRRSGWESEYWPTFARQVDNAGQHLTKAGAQIWIRHLLAMEPVAARELGVEAERREPPTLPRYLLDMIGEYGMARSDGVGQLEVQHRWETLIGGIKRYASDFTRSAAQSTAPVSTGQAGDAVIEAARKLIKAKGRYHTEQSYKALMAEVQAYNALGDAVQKMDSPNNSPVGANKEPK